MPSTRGFIARRRGVPDSRLPPVHNDASADLSVQIGDAFTPARSYAGYAIDIAHQGPAGVRPGPPADRIRMLRYQGDW
ncbi:hypothetical protein GCM10009608_76850 [Pseudonocardia alaniniphila]